ncbi:centrosomal protein of 41 kDa isoform 1-T1 [Synchiropus picturatus]
MAKQLVIGDPEFLNRRIPMNRRYLHIKSVLDTGYSMSKYLEKLDEMHKNYRFRKGEIFKRLMVTKLAELILSVGASMNKDSKSTASADNIDLVPVMDLEKQPKATSCRSTLLSVVTGVGQMSVQPNDPAAVNYTSVDLNVPYPDCPYLLLDVRDREQYERCHVISAFSFPRTMISRTMVPYPRIMLDYKNAPGKVIILYDENERLAVDVATYLCEIGYKNLFMLSGGLKVISIKFPEGMVTGSFPISCYPKKKKYNMPKPVKAECNRWRFTADELNKIKNFLEIQYKSTTQSEAPVGLETTPLFT